MYVPYCFFLIRPAYAMLARWANVSFTECPDGPDPFNNIATERKRINISLGQEHECPLLFIPYECKLLLSSYLMGIYQINSSMPLTRVPNKGTTFNTAAAIGCTTW